MKLTSEIHFCVYGFTKQTQLVFKDNNGKIDQKKKRIKIKI